MPLHVVRFDEALQRLVQLARGERPAYAVTANVDHVIRLGRNPELRPLYADADLSVAALGGRRRRKRARVLWH